MRTRDRIISITALSSLLIVGMVGSGLAAEATVGADVVSAYVWRGITFNDSLVVQPSLDVAHPSGIGFNVWGNYDARDGDIDGDGVNDVSGDDFQEIDLTVSYAIPVEGFDLSVGLIDYTFPGGGSSTLETYVSGGVALGEYVSLGLTGYYDVDEVEDYYLSASVGVTLPLTKSLGLDLGASAGYAGEDMSAGTDSGFHDYNFSAATAIPLAESVELGMFVAYTGSFDDDVLPDQEVDLYGGVGVYHSF